MHGWDTGCSMGEGGGARQEKDDGEKEFWEGEEGYFDVSGEVRFMGEGTVEACICRIQKGVLDEFRSRYLRSP